MEKLKGLLLLGIFLAFTSCSNEVKRPEEIIPPDTLSQMLIEIHIAEAKVNQSKLPRDSALSYYVFLESEIMNKYNVDTSRYHQSMRYYTENIRQLDEIYEVVLDSLNLRKSKEDMNQD